jgi:hypothetical protein
MKKGKSQKPRGPEGEVILLRDLAPRSDVKGGAGKILFGQRLDGGRGAEEGRPSAADRPKRKR